MSILAGEIIPLTAFLTKNGIKQSGQTVIVTVIDLKTSNELLTNQVLSEIGSTGKYIFNWLTPPLVKSNLCAIYTWNNQSKQERINIIEEKENDSKLCIVIGKVNQLKVLAKIDSGNNVINAKITSPKIKGIITDPIVNARIIQTPKIIAKIKCE